MAALETAFPSQFERVLGRTRTHGFIANDSGFGRQPSNSVIAHLDVQLPRNGVEAARFAAPGGAIIRVREIGAEGNASQWGRAVAYRRSRGLSVWTVTSGGAEEWLHLAAGSVESEDAVAAAWEVEGATPVNRNGTVALVDKNGIARIWVTATEAYGKDGRKVAVRLNATENRVELHADARGEEILVDPGWAAVAPVVTGRFSGTLTLLPSGKALLANGFTGSVFPKSAELYDPAANTWSPAGNMASGRFLPGATLLPDGRVLVIGGQTTTAPTYVATTELYDPATNIWSAAGAMSTPRGVPSVALLPDGKVLAAGGYNGAAFVATAEKFNPATNQWSAAQSMTFARGLGVVVRLNNNKILVAGGSNGNPVSPTAIASAELYDPATDTWASAGSMTTARYWAAGALLPNGKVLITGGVSTGGADVAKAEIYDPATNTWASAADMVSARGRHSGILVGGGQFLAAGGRANGSAVATSELYNPATNTWTSAGDMSSPRFQAQSITLTTGDALVASGDDLLGFSPLTSVDIYYLASQATGTMCTEAPQCASGFCVDGVCCEVASCVAKDACHVDGTCQGGTGTCSNPVNADGASCDNGNPCTQADTCQSGVCVSGVLLQCVPQDQCHTIGTCDPMTGVCSNPIKTDGTTCDDEDQCTQVDTCQSGVCMGANPLACAAQDQCHDAGMCDPMTGMCSNPVKMDGGACDDGEKCTQVDTCLSGVCMGADPVACAAQDQCHDAGMCDPMTGVCSNPVKMGGAACDDGDKCTQVDTCLSGTCMGANPVTCVAQDECHEKGDCDSATGTCSSPVAADGSPCSKGVCQEGSCTDSGAGGGGTDDLPDTSGGCGCRVAAKEGEDGTSLVALAVLALAALTFERRRHSLGASRQSLKTAGMRCVS